ncbi:hypothetical protein KI387_023654, partial [Taxus chinensis]
MEWSLTEAVRARRPRKGKRRTLVWLEGDSGLVEESMEMGDARRLRRSGALALGFQNPSRFHVGLVGKVKIVTGAARAMLRAIK